MKNGDKIQNALQKKFHQRTVPQIIINQEFIGGCDSLQRINSTGELDVKLGKS